MSVLLVIESRHSLCEGANHTIIQSNCIQLSECPHLLQTRAQKMVLASSFTLHCHVKDVAIACLRFSFLLRKLVPTHNDRHSNRFRDPYQLCLQHTTWRKVWDHWTHWNLDVSKINSAKAMSSATSAIARHPPATWLHISGLWIRSLIRFLPLTPLPTQHRVRANSRNNRSKPSPHVNLELSSR